MESCKDLQDYALYVYRVRKNALTMSIEDAVEDAINACIQDDILRDFLTLNKAEAKKMSIYEYNEEEHMRMERRDAFEEGFQQATMKERANTEHQRKRAEQAEAELEKYKAELEKLKEEMEMLKSQN